MGSVHDEARKSNLEIWHRVARFPNDTHNVVKSGSKDQMISPQQVGLICLTDFGQPAVNWCATMCDPKLRPARIPMKAYKDAQGPI